MKNIFFVLIILLRLKTVESKEGMSVFLRSNRALNRLLILCPL